MFPGFESLPFARESSEVFDHPSMNLGRIRGGGDIQNKLLDRCLIDVDIRHLPRRDPDALLEAARLLERFLRLSPERLDE